MTFGTVINNSYVTLAQYSDGSPAVITNSLTNPNVLLTCVNSFVNISDGIAPETGFWGAGTLGIQHREHNACAICLFDCLGVTNYVL